MYRKILTGFFLAIACLFFTACNSTKEPVAELTAFTGNVKARLEKSSPFNEAVSNLKIPDGGELTTGENATAQISMLKEKTVIKLGETTHFEIKNYSQHELKQLGGVAIYQVAPQETKLKVETPHGIATVLGTIFRLDVNATQTVLIVEEGKVSFAEKDYLATVDAGKIYYSGKKKEPEYVDPETLNKFFSENLKKHFNLR